MITQEQIDKKQKELEEMKKEFEKKNTEFTIIKCNGKKYCIFKLTKYTILKDYVFPKGIRWAEFQELVDLYESDEFDFESYKYYYAKHFSKKQQDKGYFADLYDNGGDRLSVYADDNGSNRGGFVVGVKENSK